MEEVFRSGPMAPGTMVIGNLTRLVAKEDCFITKEMCMMVSGLMIWQMALVFIFMLMGVGTQETGKMTSSMV